LVLGLVDWLSKLHGLTVLAVDVQEVGVVD
jgi:hypothetical protein